MINLILVRHGDCDNKGLYTGRGSDVPLTELGKSQIKTLAESLKSDFKENRPDFLYSSPMSRTMGSAEIIAGIWDTSVQQVPGLEEIDFGKWEGCSYSEINKDFPESLSQWIGNPVINNPPGGESLLALKERVLRVLPLPLTADNRDEDKNIIIVSHRGPIAVIILELLGLELDMFWNFTINRGSKSRVNIYPRFNELYYLNLTAVP